MTLDELPIFIYMRTHLHEAQLRLEKFLVQEFLIGRDDHQSSLDALKLRKQVRALVLENVRCLFESFRQVLLGLVHGQVSDPI